MVTSWHGLVLLFFMCAFRGESTGIGGFAAQWASDAELDVFFDASLTNYHYDHVIMGAIAYQITSLTIVYSAVYSDADQRKHQSSVSLAFVWGIHRGPVNSPHKWPVTRKMVPFDDVIMIEQTAPVKWDDLTPMWDHSILMVIMIK